MNTPSESASGSPATGAKSQAPIRVLIVDDQSLVRDGLALIAGSAADIEVVGTAENGRAGVAAALQLRPDIVLMDIRMPVMDGIAATTQLLQHDAESRDIRVIALTTYDSEDFAVRMLAAGASGFLLKDAPGEDLVRSIRTVHAGNAILDPAMTRALIGRMVASDGSGSGADASGSASQVGGASAVGGESGRDAEAVQKYELLSARERDVFALLIQGASNAEIASNLYLAPVTVKSHVGRILEKLELPDRVHVVIWAYEHGFARG